MKLLLDTHVWLWSALQPDRITARVARELASPDNELWLSAVSVWELTILLQKGRLRITEDISAWVAKSMADLEMTEAPFTVEVALALSSIAFSHGDPADRFIAATAKVFDLTLITSDERLLHLPEIKVMSNR